MPPKETSWAVDGGMPERDLIMAIASNSDGFKGINWAKVKSTMDKLGHTFTKSAMEQRWSKKIIKEWRARVGTDDNAEESPASAPASAKKRARTKAMKPEDDAEDGNNFDPPAKKPKGKTAGAKVPKKEEAKEEAKEETKEEAKDEACETINLV
ncbi:hypothetical protein ACHAQA_007414 [Verticillium albo-atrum]